MSLRFSGMQKENWLFRSINTIVETSLLNSSNKTVGDKKMSIEVIDLSTGRTELINDKFTEKNGNISFTIPTWQYWYKRQRYFLKIIHFRTNTKDLDETKNSGYQSLGTMGLLTVLKLNNLMILYLLAWIKGTMVRRKRAVHLTDF